MGKKERINDLESRNTELNKLAWQATNKILDLEKQVSDSYAENMNLQRAITEARELISKDEEIRALNNQSRIIEECHDFLDTFNIPSALKQGEQETYTETEYTLLERLSLLVQVQPKECELQLKIIDLEKGNINYSNYIQECHQLLDSKGINREPEWSYANSTTLYTLKERIELALNPVAYDAMTVPGLISKLNEENKALLGKIEDYHKLRQDLSALTVIKNVQSVELRLIEKSVSRYQWLSADASISGKVESICVKLNYAQDWLEHVNSKFDNLQKEISIPSKENELLEDRCNSLQEILSLINATLDEFNIPLNIQNENGSLKCLSLPERVEYGLSIKLPEYERGISSEKHSLVVDERDEYKNRSMKLSAENQALQDRLNFLESYISDLNLGIYKLKGIDKADFLARCEACFNKETGDTSLDVSSCFDLMSNPEYCKLSPFQVKEKLDSIKTLENRLSDLLEWRIDILKDFREIDFFVSRMKEGLEE